MRKTIFKTLLLLMVLLPGCKEDHQQQEEVTPDYSSLFNYPITIWCNNMTDETITLELVYFGYKKENISPNVFFAKTRVNALDMLYYFHVDLSDSYLQNGEIRYIVSCNKKVLKIDFLNRNNNLADMIITKNNKGEIEISGSGNKHLD